MTLERGLVEDRTSLERSPSVRCRELCVHDPSVPDIQCLFCLQTGPVVEAKYEQADPRREGFDRALKQLSRHEFMGKEYAEQYLRHQYRRNCRPNTMRGTAKGIELFLIFVTKAGKTRLEQITRADLYGFIEHQQDRGLKPTTVHARLQSAKAFLRFLIDCKILDADVLSGKITIKLPQALPRAMDPDDVKRLLHAVKDTRDRAMILVLLRTAMRIGELLNTRPRDVNLKERKIDIYEGEKNRTGRVVYLSDDAQAALKAWFRKRDSYKEWLFYGRSRGNQMSYAGARYMFIKYLKLAGIDHKGYSLHCLRHTCASELLNAGMRLECLQQLLGHHSVEMTRRYARLTDKTREEEYFRAMSIIEKGDINGHHGINSELQTVPKETELLSSHSEELHEHP
jgi:integrase/recombinase XerD